MVTDSIGFASTMEAMAQDLTEDEETGPPVPENLATLVDKMIKKRIPEEKVRVLLDKQIRPSNVEMLRNPKCNPHIWMRLKAATRRNAIRTGHIGDKITLLIIANTTKTVASLALFKDKIPPTHTKEVKDITKSLLDATQLGVVALHEVNQKRRSDMKYDLHASYRGLCSPPVEEATVLFGSLNERVKELNEVILKPNIYDNYRLCNNSKIDRITISHDDLHVFKHSLIAGPEDGQAGHGLWSRDHERQEAGGRFQSYRGRGRYQQPYQQNFFKKTSDRGKIKVTRK